jgi:outer membrane lipoprotein SlyB
MAAANVATSQQPPVANPQAGTTTAAPIGTTANPPANESTRPVHHTSAPTHHEEARDNAPQQVAAAPACASCGVIEGYSAVKVQGQNNGVGAVAGGLGGALVGSKIAGRGNHTVGGIVGAIGGGLLGNAIESHERTSTAYDVRVRMDDGSVRTVRQATIPTVGQHVNVDGHTLRAMDAQG